VRVCEWARTHVSAWCGHGMGEGRGVGQATRWVTGKGGGARGLCWAGDKPPLLSLPLAGLRNRGRHCAVCACVE
jgi:hypothetical protein